MDNPLAFAPITGEPTFDELAAAVFDAEAIKATTIAQSEEVDRFTLDGVDVDAAAWISSRAHPAPGLEVQRGWFGARKGPRGWRRPSHVSPRGQRTSGAPAPRLLRDVR